MVNVSKELLDHLKQTFPISLTPLNTPERQLWFHQGQLDIVHNYLQHLFNSQFENTSEGIDNGNT